eukprot:358441-Chlamydomonas_euryale.AAC.1
MSCVGAPTLKPWNNPTLCVGPSAELGELRDDDGVYEVDFLRKDVDELRRLGYESAAGPSGRGEGSTGGGARRGGDASDGDRAVDTVGLALGGAGMVGMALGGVSGCMGASVVACVLSLDFLSRDALRQPAGGTESLRAAPASFGWRQQRLDGAGSVWMAPA